MPSQLFRALRCFIFFPAATGSPELSEKKCVPLLKVLQSPPIGAIFGRNCSFTRFYSLHRLEQSSAETAVLPSSRSRATSTREHAPRALALQIARGIQDGRRLNPVTAIILQVLKYQKPSKTATIAKIQTIVIIMILCEYIYI